MGTRADQYPEVGFASGNQSTDEMRVSRYLSGETSHKGTSRAPAGAKGIYRQ
jgi:hypothetical protein